MLPAIISLTSHWNKFSYCHKETVNYRNKIDIDDALVGLQHEFDTMIVIHNFFSAIRYL